MAEKVRASGANSNGEPSNDAIGNIFAGRRKSLRERDDDEVVARIQRTAERAQELRHATLGDLAAAIICNEVSTDDAVAIFDGVVFPMLAKLCSARGDDAGGQAALRLACGSIRVLLAPGKYDEALVLKLDAIAHGFSVDATAIAIVELAEMVERSVGFRGCKIGVPFDHPTTTVAEQTPSNFRNWLAKRYGQERVPTVEEIAGMLDRHTDKRARGKLTTAGIVARILGHGNLLGANVGGAKAMLHRVDKALKRHRG